MKVAISSEYGGFKLSAAAALYADFLKPGILGCRFYGKMLGSTGIPQGIWPSSDLSLRSDPILIRAIEESGNIGSDYALSAIKIVDVPDDADVYISDYDGKEAVEEKHRIWR